jgi:predicted short-subunit dehydrogenase-like oxidoreductase (DUF2520 family)
MKVVLIGSGSVATQLGLALQTKGVIISQVYSRNVSNAETLAEKLNTSFITDISEIYKEADIYFYALTDNAFKSILRKIEMPNGIQVHTAGCIPMNEFEGFTTKFGVFYPLQTFSKNKTVDFSQIPICIEASNMEVQQLLLKIADLLSVKTYLINSENRKKLHLAAVFACNFTNYMYDIASKILEESGLLFDMIQPLIEETAEKIKTLKPYDAQTGPAVRMDEITINKHLVMLNKNPELKKIYKLMTKNIYNRHKKQ